MNKKILIGSMLVLTLLLLMPTIPAIQQNIVKDDIKEKNDILIAKNSSYDIEKLLETPKDFPLLYLFVVGVLQFQMARVDFLMKYAVDFFNREIKHPLLLLRAYMILEAYDMWWNFWNALSTKLGWNWFE